MSKTTKTIFVCLGVITGIITDYIGYTNGNTWFIGGIVAFFICDIMEED